MTATPIDPTQFEIVQIPVEQVKLDHSLLVDRGDGPELLEVGNVRFRAIQDADGNYVNTYRVTSEAVRGGTPWFVEYAAGTPVSRILGPSRG